MDEGVPVDVVDVPLLAGLNESDRHDWLRGSILVDEPPLRERRSVDQATGTGRTPLVVLIGDDGLRDEPFRKLPGYDSWFPFGGWVIVVRGRCMKREVRDLDSLLLNVVLVVVHAQGLEDLLAFVPIV